MLLLVAFVGLGCCIRVCFWFLFKFLVALLMLFGCLGWLCPQILVICGEVFLVVDFCWFGVWLFRVWCAFVLLLFLELGLLIVLLGSYNSSLCVCV